MLYPEKVRILAKKNLPKPEEARYWIDLTADPYGGIWKVWNGLTWIRVFASSGSGGGIEEAPSDGNLYGRKNLVWSEIDIPDVSIYATKTELELKADKDSVPDLSNYLTASDIAKYYLPKGDYLTEIPEGYLTITEADGRYALKGESGEDIDLSDYLTIAVAAATYATKSEVQEVQEGVETLINAKLDTLVSGTNIKTVNGTSLLGSGNITLETPEGGLSDAASDGKLYGRKDGTWSEIVIPDTSGLATKTELSNKLDTETYNADKATFALKTEIPDTSTFITTETADGKYQPKGTYLTEVPAEYITETELTDKGYATTTQLSSKQDTLVSGTNIKTINSQSLLGEGNIEITSGTGGITDAPSDGKLYGRKNAAWTEVTTPDLSSYATQEYVNTQVSNLVNSAPEALNTLDELAAALGDDANFATTVTNSLASKAALSGAEFTGTIGAPIVALNRSSEGMMGAIQAESNDILFRTYNAGVDSMTFLVQSSTPLKITEAGIWENNQLLENKYAQLSDLDDLATTAQLNNKQDTLVSGTNIKTINGETVLGSGNITIQAPAAESSMVDITNILYSTSGLKATITSEDYITLKGYVEAANKTMYVAPTFTSTSYVSTSIVIDATYSSATGIVLTLMTHEPSSDGAGTLSKISIDTAYNVTETNFIEDGVTADDLKLLSNYQAASTATAPAANDTYEQAIAKLHAYINQLESISGILNREDIVQESSLSNLPNNKNYILASVSSNQTLSFTTSGWANNTSVHVFVYNSSSSEITVTIPNTGSYVNMSSETLTIPGNTGAEIDAFKDERGNIWVRHAAGELTINPDMV